MTKDGWLNEHPKAEADIQRWIAARLAGQSTESVRTLSVRLRVKHGWPFGPDDRTLPDANFGTFLHARYPDLMEQIMAEAAAPADVPMTDEEALAEDRAKHARRSEESKSKQVIRALERELADERERSGLLHALDAAPPAEPFHIERTHRHGGVQAAAYVMLASDWHVGERVRPSTVGGRNEYSPEIAQDRARQYWKSNLLLLDAARAAWEISDAVLWLGGDLITGYIHEEYQEDNFLSPVEETLLAFEMVSAGIKTFLAESGVARLLIPTSHGNHGRTTLKKRVSTSARNSYEWMLYQMLAKHFADEPRVTFQIAEGYHNIVDVYGFRIRFHHGDEVGFGGGVGGLSVPINRRIGRQAKGDVYPIDLDVLGHFHQRLFPGNFIVNGSLIGWTPFAESKGFGFEPAAQTSFVVDERYRVVSNYNAVIVDKTRSK